MRRRSHTQGGGRDFWAARIEYVVFEIVYLTEPKDGCGDATRRTLGRHTETRKHIPPGSLRSLRASRADVRSRVFRQKRDRGFVSFPKRAFKAYLSRVSEMCATESAFPCVCRETSILGFVFREGIWGSVRRPLRERRLILELVLALHDGGCWAHRLRMVPHKVVDDAKRSAKQRCDTLRTYFEDVVARGGEGCVAKNLLSPYVPRPQVPQPGLLGQAQARVRLQHWARNTRVARVRFYAEERRAKNEKKGTSSSTSSFERRHLAVSLYLGAGLYARSRNQGRKWRGNADCV